MNVKEAESTFSTALLVAQILATASAIILTLVPGVPDWLKILLAVLVALILVIILGQLIDVQGKWRELQKRWKASQDARRFYPELKGLIEEFYEQIKGVSSEGDPAQVMYGLLLQSADRRTPLGLIRENAWCLVVTSRIMGAKHFGIVAAFFEQSLSKYHEHLNQVVAEFQTKQLTVDAETKRSYSEAKRRYIDLLTRVERFGDKSDMFAWHWRDPPEVA